MATIPPMAEHSMGGKFRLQREQHKGRQDQCDGGKARRQQIERKDRKQNDK